MNNLEKTALAGIKKTEHFFRSIGMPVRLSEVNIGEEHIEQMAKKGTERGALGNFVKLYEADIVNILNLAR